jgi:hypothetical protein
MVVFVAPRAARGFVALRLAEEPPCVAGLNRPSFGQRFTDQARKVQRSLARYLRSGARACRASTRLIWAFVPCFSSR